MENNSKKNSRYHRRTSVIRQVAAFFAIAVIITGAVTYVSQRMIAEMSVRKSTEELGYAVAQDAILSIKEYPAYEFLIKYWYDHGQMMELEYDIENLVGSETEKKCEDFLTRHPTAVLKSMTPEEVKALSNTDQKIYAEIIYAWLNIRFNQIKRTYGVDYLFCIIAEEDFTKQYFLMSAADEGAVRGYNYEEVYPLGKTVTIEEDSSQQWAMKTAITNNSFLADAGNYVDYYAFLGDVEGHTCFIGLTYNIPDIEENIRVQTFQGTTYAVILQVVLSMITLALISTFVLTPLKGVQQGIRQYKINKDSRQAQTTLSKVSTRNEVGELADDVIELTQEIDDYVREIEHITADKQRIGVELELASKIQSQTLPNTFPPFPDRKEIDLYASMIPAKEVGGDFYDFFMIDDDHLALVIADVSGKGVPAALFMMTSMLLIHNATADGQSPGEALEMVNDQICAKNSEEMFVSVWLGILEISTGILTSANAGHEYPAIMNSGDSFVLEKTKHDFVIGGMPGIKYKNNSEKLRSGSKIFVYTDGVPEATDADKKMYGTDRMIDALNAGKNNEPKELLAGVKASVDDFVKDAEQFDDLTMMCLVYYGKTEEQEDK